MEAFLFDVANEAFWSTLLPFVNELHAHAMRAFGNYDMEALAPFVVAPSVFGSIILYFVGCVILYWLLKRGITPPSYAEIQQQGKYACALSFLSLLAAVPMFGFVTLIGCGVYRLNPWMVVGLSMISHGVGYQMEYLS